VCYSKDVKGYKLLQPHSNTNFIRRNVKFDENLLACKPDSTFVPSTTCDSSSTFVSSYVHIMVSSSSSDDDNKDENSPPPVTFLQVSP
jgi:hypothetical protein